MKKRILLAALCVLILTIFYIVKTYALFETNANGESSLTIGKWSIYINRDDVTYSETIDLTQFTYDSNSHVRPGYIAPGNGGEFFVDLNASGTDVSMICTIEMDNSELIDHPNINIEIASTSRTNLLDSNKNFKFIINHDDSIKNAIVTYRLDWNNINEYDEADTELIGGDIKIKLDVHCQQYLGE